MLRVVVDANVIISALIRPDSVPGRVVRAGVEGGFYQMLTSPPLMEELRGSLNYPRLQRYVKMDPGEREEFLLLLEQLAEPVSLVGCPVPGICRDPRDEPYLQTALAGRADYIVSGDKDLLDLQAVESVRIVGPADFARLLVST